MHPVGGLYFNPGGHSQVPFAPSFAVPAHTQGLVAVDTSFARHIIGTQPDGVYCLPSGHMQTPLTSVAPLAHIMDAVVVIGSQLLLLPPRQLPVTIR
jgi:hypothetical protein